MLFSGSSNNFLRNFKLNNNLNEYFASYLKLKFSWQLLFRDGKPVQEKSENVEVKKQGRKQSIIIKDAKIEDVAVYTCVAENVKTKTELELKGSEEKIETVTKEVKEQVVTKGQDMSYKVDFKKELHRKPNVKWMFKNKEVDTSSERVSWKI